MNSGDNVDLTSDLKYFLKIPVVNLQKLFLLLNSSGLGVGGSIS